MNQLHIPKLSPFNKILIITVVVLFVCESILSHFFQITLSSLLGFILQNFSSPWKWHTIVTYPLLSSGLFEMLLNCLMIWMMGSDFEFQWGLKKYLGFLLSVIIGGALSVIFVGGLFLPTLRSIPLMGLSGIVTGLCAAYAFLFPHRHFSFMMVFPVKAWVFCSILAFISLYQGIFTPYGVGAFSSLSALLFGFIYMYLMANGKTWFGGGSGGGNFPGSQGRKKKANHLKIVKAESSESDHQGPKIWH